MYNCDSVERPSRFHSCRGRGRGRDFIFISHARIMTGHSLQVTNPLKGFLFSLVIVQKTEDLRRCSLVTIFKHILRDRKENQFLTGMDHVNNSVLDDGN